jgi:hypothetical protein
MGQCSGMSLERRATTMRRTFPMGIVILVSLVIAFAALIAVALIAAGRSRRRTFSGRNWGDEGPLGEEALVRVGPPRKPLADAAAALPLPDPEPEAVEAFGREVREGESGTDALAS